MKVKFVFTPEYNEVTAVFVDSVWPNGVIDMYAHIGQHGAGSNEWFEQQQPATLEQYAPLLAELQSIGYEVGFNVPIAPFTRWSYDSFDTGKFRQGDVIIDEQGEVSVVLQVHSDGEFRGDANGNGCEGRYATLEEITSQRPEILVYL
jgi:hypothetical protein